MRTFDSDGAQERSGQGGSSHGDGGQGDGSQQSSGPGERQREAPKGLAGLMPDRATKIEPIEIPELQLPKGGGALRGIDEKFAVNSANGTASLTISLPLTPNRDAYTPKIDLSYSSGAGNGPFGMGWSLGLSSIQRKTDKRLPRYLNAPDEDQFMVSGAEDLVQQLAEQGPGDWQPLDVTANGYRVRAYRPRIAGDFARIERIVHPLHGEYWKVTDRTNTATVYGRSPAARIADPEDGRRIFKWLPEFSYDNRGNWIAYEYKAENSDDMPPTSAEANRLRGLAPFANTYLKRVRYGNHAPYYPDPASPYDPQAPADGAYHFELVLDYGEHAAAAPEPSEVPGQTWPYRADAFSNCRAGFEIRTARLCRRMLVFHHFPGEAFGSGVLVRSLDFTYTPALVNGIAQAAATHLTAIEQAGYIRRPDGSYSRKAIPPLEFEYQQVDWDMAVRTAAPEEVVDAPIGLSAPYQFVDLYAEGIAGILCEDGGAWVYKHNRGDRTATGQVSFERGSIIGPRPNVSGLAGGALTLEDLDASGEKQIVVNGPQLGGYFELGSDDLWQTFRPFALATNLDYRDPSIRRIDLTGDGRLSIVVAEDDAFVWHASDGKNGFKAAERALKALDEERGPAVVFAESKQTIFLADMNGDGLTDIVRIRSGEIAYWPNMGYGRFGAKVAMAQAPVFDHPDSFDPTKLRLADITGDGTADLVYAGGDGVRAWLNLGGNGCSDAVALDGVPPVTAVRSLQIADLLGQGTPCLIWSSLLSADAGAPLQYVDLMGGHKPHLLTRYANNMGKETRLDYRSSTYFYLVDKNAGTHWVTRLPFPVQVVERQVVEELVTGSRLTSSYTYHHGYWDPEEREFRGFGRVDRLDSEDYDRWAVAAGVLEGSRELFQAPMLTRTWYHVGAWDRRERILTQFEDEYWPRAYDRAFPAAPLGAVEPALPEGRIVAAPTVADPLALAKLSADERREALRACKTLVLRQEVFALDAPAAGATEADLQRQMLPYSVDTHTCHIQLLQPRGPNRYAVFLVVEDEALKISYERRPGDERIEHALNLEIDELGNVLEKANVVYGRDPIQAALAADALAAAASDFGGFGEQARLQAALAGALSRAETAQTRMGVVVTRHRFTHDIDTPAAWRSRVPSEEETFEITGAAPAAVLFTAGELRGILNDPASTEIAFHAQPAAGVERRRIEHQRTLYYDEALGAPLPLHQFASHGLAFQGQYCALTPGLIGALYGPRIADPAAELPPGGYVHSEGDANWWIPTGTVRYLDPGDTVADARARFYKPHGHIDPFGSETTVRYHKDYFLFLEETADAVGNVTRVEAFDFRLLSPSVLRDANDNLSAVVSDELALVKAQAFLGKDLDGDGTPELEIADSLAGISADSTAEGAAVAALLASADSAAMDPLARQLLQGATFRFVYDLDAWRTRGMPAVAMKIVRERHHSDDPNARLHLSCDYTDGSGALAMTKTQAEPGLAHAVTVNPDNTVTVSDVDTAAMAPPRLRWVGSGRLVLNNKGKPVRRYEPYFSVTPHFESLPELVATGVSAVLTYDPAGRLVRTDLPDGTFVHTEFDAWHLTTHDAGDTVLQSRWHAERVGRLIDAELLAQGRDPAREAAAALQAEIYAGTPETVLLDAFARPVLSLAHNGFDGGGGALYFPASLVLDVEGNVQEVIDARGGSPMRYGYDMVGRRLTQHSMDAGRRWMLPTVGGKPLVKWDERSHVVRYGYDALQRPLRQHVGGGDAATPLDNVVMLALYGEGAANDRELGLRGKLYRRWDTGGLEEWSAFDGKNNLLQTVRRFALDYRATVDWSGDLDAPLEAEAHVTRHTYDAINRVTSTTAPDGSVTERRYNEANLLEAVNVTLPGGAVEAIASAVTYDAMGQRKSITYGNGTITTYRHDPLTFRLIGIATVKSDGTPAQDLLYTHDCAGNLTHLEDRAIPAVFFNNVKVQAISTFAYDPLYRLISAEGREHAGQAAGFGPEDNWNDAIHMVRHQPGDVMAWRNYAETYRHDPVGNLLQLTHTATNGSYTRTYTYEAATNRLASTTVGADNYPYDHHPAHGFLRQMPHLSLMRYSFRDELAATARQAVAAGTPETTYYVYDYEGLRIRKVTDRAAPPGAAPARKDERLYVGPFEIYRNYAGADAGLERSTLSVMDDIVRVAMIDTRNAVDDGTPPRVTRYQLSNHIGSSVMELDATGRTLSYEEYHPYGTTAYQATDSTLAVAVRRYRYSGMERDEESGLSHHNARYYAPWIARWTKADPAGLADGINDYQYVAGNPIRLADPSGKGAWDRFLGGVKMVGGALETVAGGALVVAGAASSEIGIGIPIAAAGAFVTAHGADVTVSGARTMWNGEQVDTFTSQGLQAVGMSRTSANLTDAGISIVGSLGASAVTRAPTVAAAADEALTAGDDVLRAATTTAGETTSAGQSSVSLAFSPGLPTGHNMVGVTTGGTTTWSHLVVDSLDEVSGGMSRVASSGTNATVVASRGPALAQSTYLTVTVPVTQAQAQAARAAMSVAEAGGGNAGVYSYLGNNCTTYATSVLREAGLFAPSASTPASAFVTTALQSPAVVQPIALGGAGLATGVGVGTALSSSSDAPVSEPAISMEPPVSTAPAVSEPEPAPDAAQDQGVCYSENVSSSESSQTSSAEGYYDTVEGVCYSY